MKKTTVLIDAEPLLQAQGSGVTIYIDQLVKAMDKHKDPRFNLRLFTGLNKIFKRPSSKIKYRYIPAPGRVVKGLAKRGLLPSLSLFLGRGFYLFGNYHSLPTGKSKKAVIIYDLAYLSYPEFINHKNLVHLDKVVKKSADESDLIITISRFSKNEIIEKLNIDPEKIIIASPSVDTNQFRPASKEKVLNCVAKYSLPNKYILFVGNTEPRKNISKLIDGYLIAKKQNPQLPMLVLAGGSGWNNIEINKKISENSDSITKAGYVHDDDMAALYTGAAAFVYVPVYEGYGIPPLEAMACGTPVLASNNTSVPEATKDAALSVDPFSATDIADGILTIVDNKSVRNKLSKAGLKRTEGSNWELSAKIVLDGIAKVS